MGYENWGKTKGWEISEGGKPGKGDTVGGRELRLCDRFKLHAQS